MKLEETLEHLTIEEKEFVRAKLTEQADFFATKQYPSRVEARNRSRSIRLTTHR